MCFLINWSLNEDKEPNLTTNYRSSIAKRFANYALKTEMEEVIKILQALCFGIRGARRLKINKWAWRPGSSSLL
jgi:hypothetical protein